LAHRLRRDFGQCLREAVGDTVAETQEIDEELRYLRRVVGLRHDPGPA
jgi:hypothetical protein